MTTDLDVADLAKAAEFFHSDGLIVTGRETGHSTDIRDLDKVREVTRLPVIVGSGVTEENLLHYRGKADVLIVGSHFKVGGRWHGDVDEDRVRSFMAKHRLDNTKR